LAAAPLPPTLSDRNAALNPYKPSVENDLSDPPAAFNRSLLSRHLYSMLIAGVAIACLPRVLDLLEPSGSAADRLRSLPFFSDSFGLAGGMLVLWSLHLLSVVRKCRK